MNYEEQITRVNEKNPFMIHNQIQAVSVSAERSVVRAVIVPESKNAMGGVHAGLFFALGEIAAGLLARSDGSRQVTLDTSFRFLQNSMHAEVVEAEAAFIKKGRNITMCRSVIREQGKDNILAEGEFSFYCLKE